MFLQVFLKHVSDDGVMRNVEFQASGDCVTPKAGDVKGAGPELDLMMTSGLQLSQVKVVDFHNDDAALTLFVSISNLIIF